MPGGATGRPTTAGAGDSSDRPEPLSVHINFLLAIPILSFILTPTIMYTPIGYYYDYFNFSLIDTIILTLIDTVVFTTISL